MSEAKDEEIRPEKDLRDDALHPPPSPHRPVVTPPLLPAERRLLLLEMAAVLVLGPVTRAAGATYRLLEGKPDRDFDLGGSAALAAQYAGLTVLVILLGLRSREERERFGLVRPEWADLVLTLGVLGGGTLLGKFLVWFAELWAHTFVHTSPVGVFRSQGWDEALVVGCEWTALHAMLAAVCVAYLVPRLRRLGWHPIAAVLAGAALQGAGRLGGYPTHALQAVGLGVVAGFTFLQFPRVTPVVLAGALGGIAALSRTLIRH